MEPRLEFDKQDVCIQEIVRYDRRSRKCCGFIEEEDEGGAYGMGGDLNIRPKYQREFIYKPAQQAAVIHTVKNGFPLGSPFYWVKNREGTYEVLDGQQRIMSICKYIRGDFSIKWGDDKNKTLIFDNLTDNQQDKILNYKLEIRFCKGADEDLIEWFQIINTYGEKMNDQEIRNAVLAGPWVSDAKRYFSRNTTGAYKIANKYLLGSANRQQYLKTAIEWISKGDIQGYMNKHKEDKNADELWEYFKKVIEWVEKIFPIYREEMKGRPFGLLYNIYRGNEYNPDEIEEKIQELIQNEDVTDTKGIYEYILTGDEKYLNIRVFSDKQKREAYESQKGICHRCGEHFKYEDMEGDHITPWSQGGKTTSENCKMLCKHCNRSKSDK